MMGFVMEAQSSSPRCLDLFLPHRTSKERGHKELTRIKGISMNGESRVGASCRDASPQHKSGETREAVLRVDVSIVPRTIKKAWMDRMCSAHSSRVVCDHLGMALGAAGFGGR